MKKLRTSIVIALLLLTVLVGSAPGSANEYLLGVGDGLSISVWGHTELDTEIVVRPDGYITFPLVGDIWAVDKTPRQLSAELQELLSEFVVNPQVTVIVSQFRTLQVQVLGEVGAPGNYQLKAGARLLDVLAFAGGQLQTANLSTVHITRYTLDEHGGEQSQVLRVDARDFLETGNLEGNPLIASGDMIFVPASGRATIFGEVREPTSYDLGSGLDVLDLLALAGGSLDSADLERVVITSQTGEKPVEQIVNVQDYMAGRSKPVVIKPNDVVFVPKKQQVMVFGAVEIPGIYSLHSDAHLIDILAQAGGVTPTGDASAVTITRRGQLEQELMVVNARPSLSGKTGGDNPRLQADDLIFVPDGYQNALVLGQVRTPGSYVVREQTRILDLLAEAGGTEDSAGEELTLTRDGVVRNIDLGSLERLGLQNEDVQPGDVIYVPESRRQVLVLGEVVNPGYYQFRPGDRILDAVGYAGGLTNVAQDDQVSLSRSSPEGTDITMFDFSELMENRYLPDNIPLVGGDVIIIPQADRGVTVLGEVEEPGYYQFRTGDSLFDAIMLAGGFSGSADAGQVTLTRQTAEGREVEMIDFSLLMKDGFVAEDRSLQGGDVIMVQHSNTNVLVFGDVVRAGSYTLPPQGRLLDILALAGGLQSNLGSEDVVVTRQDGNEEQVWSLNYSSLMTSQSEYNLALAGGDVIYVPASRRQILVLGMVNNPGVYDLPAGARVMDAIAMAGGPLERAALESVGIYRDGSIEDSELVAMGEDKVLFTGDASENPLLVGGDIIYIPETNKPDWTKIFGFVGVISSFKDAIFNIFSW